MTTANSDGAKELFASTLERRKAKPLTIQATATGKVSGKMKDMAAGKEKEVVIRDKTVGTGSEAQVGDEIGIYYQIRDRNGIVFFKQIQGQLVSSMSRYPFAIADEITFKDLDYHRQGKRGQGYSSPFVNK